jgi:hypothetical protein
MKAQPRLPKVALLLIVGASYWMMVLMGYISVRISGLQMLKQEIVNIAIQRVKATGKTT